MTKTISGHMIIKNGIKYDYPFIEACLSILPICKEFIFIEGYGEDGSYEAILELQKQYPDKIKVFQEHWQKEHFSILSEMTNVAIERCKCDYHFQIQADECVHENVLPEIKKAANSGADYASFGVLHFFSNFDTIYQPGVYYDSFIRFAKKSTYPNLRSYDDAMSLGCPSFDSAKFHSTELTGIKVHHYGYVRKPKFLIEKQKQMTRWWGYQELDQYLQDGDDNGKINWEQKFSPDKLRPFEGSHPAVIKQWIAERAEIVKSGIVN
jgi:hypothetical protein